MPRMTNTGQMLRTPKPELTPQALLDRRRGGERLSAHSLHFTAPPSLYQAILREAEATGENVSAVIRRVLRVALAHRLDGESSGGGA